MMTNEEKIWASLIATIIIVTSIITSAVLWSGIQEREKQEKLYLECLKAEKEMNAKSNFRYSTNCSVR